MTAPSHQPPDLRTVPTDATHTLNCGEAGWTGLTADTVGPATWARTATFKCRGFRRVQQEVVAVVPMRGVAPPIDVAGQLDYEVDAYVSARWWPKDELLTTRERCYPGRLPELLPAFLAGQRIDEPFEVWS